MVAHEFVDEHLEWAGTGMELFAGFVIVLVLFGVPYFGVSFVSQALIARGYEALGSALGVAALLSIFYLGGVARFRALRSPVAHALAGHPRGQRQQGLRVRPVLHVEDRSTGCRLDCCCPGR